MPQYILVLVTSLSANTDLLINLSLHKITVIFKPLSWTLKCMQRNTSQREPKD